MSSKWKCWDNYSLLIRPENRYIQMSFGPPILNPPLVYLSLIDLPLVLHLLVCGLLIPVRQELIVVLKGRVKKSCYTYMFI